MIGIGIPANGEEMKEGGAAGPIATGVTVAFSQAAASEALRKSGHTGKAAAFDIITATMALLLAASDNAHTQQSGLAILYSQAGNAGRKVGEEYIAPLLPEKKASEEEEAQGVTNDDWGRAAQPAAQPAAQSTTNTGSSDTSTSTSTGTENAHVEERVEVTKNVSSQAPA